MSASTAHEIGIVHYPGAQVACVLGLTDLFGVASTPHRPSEMPAGVGLQSREARRQAGAVSLSTTMSRLPMLRVRG